MSAATFCQTLEPQYVTVGGVRTHYVACGRGPTVVLIHGLSASFWNWWHNIPALAQHFHVVALDLIGCGNSDGAASAYTPDACLAQVIGLLDHLGVDQAALVGHSMGGRVALAMALQHPQRIRALALVSPAAYPHADARTIRLLTLPGIGEACTHLMHTGPAAQLVRRSLRSVMHPRAVISDDEVFWNMQSGVARRRQLAETFLRYGRDMRFHEPWQLAARYNEITVPALIITGDSDRLVAAASSEQLARTMPHAQFERWTDTGHVAHAEQPQRFNATVRAFLQSQLAPTAAQRHWWSQRFRLHHRSERWPAAPLPVPPPPRFAPWQHG